MTVPARPSRFDKQGPASRCVIAGRALGWSNCTVSATAMGISKTTLGHTVMTGCDVRKLIEPRDVSGGVNLIQMARVCRGLGLNVDLHVGSGVVTPEYAAIQLQAGRGFVLQGNASAMLGTTYRSTRGAVNHAVWVNEARGGSLGHPDQVLVYDPAADARQASWGKADKGPTWWPWRIARQFASELHPWGDSDSRLLGPGKFYCLLFGDTEPHFHSRFGGIASTPFPDRTRAKYPTVDVHSKPEKGKPTVIGSIKKGELFTAYQYATGDVYQGSPLWIGDHDGKRWVHSQRMRHVRGTT